MRQFLNEEAERWAEQMRREDRRATAIAISIGIILLSAFALASYSGEQQRRAFIAKCIEFHDVDKCHAFWNYGRTDLGERR